MNTHDTTAPTAISICSGIGGLDLAVERVFGARTVAYIEREAYCQAVLMARMADSSLEPSPIFSDVREFDGTPFRGVVDIVFGGIPCQPHSAAGKRGRQADERDLVDEFLRIVGEVEPRFAVVENVRGFLAGDGIGRLLGGLADLGLDAEWEVVSAAQVGAPHKRERVFVLGYAKGKEHSRERLGSVPVNGDAECRDHADGCDETMADPECTGLEDPRLRGRRELRVQEGGGLHHRPEQPRSQLGNPHRSGLEERGRDAVPRSFPSPWPPGPSGDWAGVPGWLHPALERSLRGVADELPTQLDLAQRHRTDRLRALGNAVVPAQATVALRALLERTNQ